MLLKSHDTVVALKHGTLAWALQQHVPLSTMAIDDRKVGSARWLAAAMAISAGEVSKSQKRLVAAGLLAESQSIMIDSDIPLPYQLVTPNMIEWLCYGIRYYSVPASTGLVRGIATGWSCEFIKSDMVAPNTPLVWQVPGGQDYGEGVEPLYPGASQAASIDNQLYKLLALIDILRLGKPRELSIARDLVHDTLKGMSNG